jgi:hypothetical protein
MPIATLDRDRVRQLFLSKGTFAASLLILCVDAYGTECFDWDPDTLLQEIQQDYNALLPQVNKDKILALITVMTTDQFYRDPIVFYQTCLALNCVPSNWNSMNEDIDAPMMAWAVTESGLIDANETGHVLEFSEDVAAYVGVVLRQSGFRTPPPILRFAKIQQPTVVDLPTDRAQGSRDRDASQHLQEYLATRLQALNQELASLPLESASSSLQDRQDPIGATLRASHRPSQPRPASAIS